MENAKYTDADRKKVELEIKKQWERWHKRKMIEIPPQCTSFAILIAEEKHPQPLFLRERSMMQGPFNRCSKRNKFSLPM
jgi:hypothetical protein